ncbi:MAG: insert subdomain of RNA polymerase alpha subunit [Monoraphidium minutum]|nr:MAG: insert subdomain of RNA polymerase alpha subunit [Monoraphidium minutum]
MAGEKKHKEKKQKEKKAQELPEHLEKQRKYVICGHDKNYHTSTATAASEYLPVGVDNAWDFREFAGGLSVVVNRVEDDGMTMEFDLIGVDPSIANALRRILIAEVPTVAIEHVFIVNNTSIIQDEVLAHRLGLVPLNVDPSLLEWRGAEDPASEANTLVLRLRVKCVRGADGGMVNDAVHASKFEWLPAGSELPDETGCRFTEGASQEERFVGRPAPAPTPGDTLLAKLRPGQEIELEAHCIKGVGREHAKWSPVATAWYRLHPEVALLRPVTGGDAEELAEAVPEVFELQPDGALGVRDVRSKEAERSLERVRRLLEDERWRGVVEVRKRKDHFIFTIESTGALPAEALFRQALAILADKADKLERRL